MCWKWAFFALVSWASDKYPWIIRQILPHSKASTLVDVFGFPFFWSHVAFWVKNSSLPWHLQTDIISLGKVQFPTCFLAEALQKRVCCDHSFIFFFWVIMSSVEERALSLQVLPLQRVLKVHPHREQFVCAWESFPLQCFLCKSSVICTCLITLPTQRVCPKHPIFDIFASPRKSSSCKSFREQIN